MTDAGSHWRSPTQWPAAHVGEVHVWRVALDLPSRGLTELAALLDDEERLRMARFHFRHDRVRFIVAHAALRSILARYLGEVPARLRFARGPFGKPQLATPGAPLRFNLSHAHELALCAVAHQREVGVDVERIRPDIARETIAERFFSARERVELQALPEEQRVLGFFNAWTRKEAFVKAHGGGLALPLDGFDVTLAPGAPAALVGVRDMPGEAGRWSLRDLPVGDGYAGAVAAEGHGWQLDCLCWSW